MISLLFTYYAEVSVAMSLVLLGMGLLSKQIDKRYRARAQYLLGGLLAFRLLIPLKLPSFHTLVNIQTSYRPQSGVFQTLSSALLTAQAEQGSSLWELLALLWFAGVLCGLLWRSAQYLSFCKWIARWGREPEPWVMAVFEEEKRNAKVLKRVSLRRCPFIQSPMAAGFAAATILLPAVDYTEEQYHMIFRHELIHCRRNDVLYQWVVALAQCVHWFNPMVYWLASQARQDVELSCDSEAVEQQDQEYRMKYAELILSVAKVTAGKPCPAVSAAFSRSGRLLKKRFENIFDHSTKWSGYTLLMAIAAVSAIATSLVAFQGRDYYSQMMRELSSQDIRSVLVCREEDGEYLNQQEIGSFSNWLNGLNVRPTPLVKSTHGNPERYIVTLRDDSVLHITAVGRYLHINGHHYRQFHRQSWLSVNL